jgi:hypothetical protein
LEEQHVDLCAGVDEARSGPLPARNGSSVEILSPLGPANQQADANAFAALIAHIKAIDGE